MNEAGRAEHASDQTASVPHSVGHDKQKAMLGATGGSTDSGSARYVIAAAAARAGVHEQTLRHYERLGLISPARKGTRARSPRLYSEGDIERVIHIRRLVVDLGVNLAGVEIILTMRERIETLQRELRQLQRYHDDLTRDLTYRQNNDARHT